jgi:mono/diheme cytochrome c family protein
MMFNETPEEIREWITDGAPRRLRDDPDFQEARRRQVVAMPAYRGVVEGADLDDLVAYVQSVSAARRPPEGSPEAEGRALAVEHGCFGCHGPEGRGLVPNPGSFKGNIPPWDSEDYLELVRSPEEFREWVADGEIRRFRENPLAARFLDAQVVKMPAYRGVLGADQIEKIRAYVEWVRAEGPIMPSRRRAP